MEIIFGNFWFDAITEAAIAETRKVEVFANRIVGSRNHSFQPGV